MARTRRMRIVRSHFGLCLGIVIGIIAAAFCVLPSKALSSPVDGALSLIADSSQELSSGLGIRFRFHTFWRKPIDDTEDPPALSR